MLFFIGSSEVFGNLDRIRTRRTGSNSKGLDVGSRESEVSEGFLRQVISRKKRGDHVGRDEINHDGAGEYLRRIYRQKGIVSRMDPQ